MTAAATPGPRFNDYCFIYLSESAAAPEDKLDKDSLLSLGQKNRNRVVIAAALVDDDDKTDGVTIRDSVQMSEIATIENHLSKEKTEHQPRTVWANVRFFS